MEIENIQRVELSCYQLFKINKFWFWNSIWSKSLQSCAIKEGAHFPSLSHSSFPTSISIFHYWCNKKKSSAFSIFISILDSWNWKIGTSPSSSTYSCTLVLSSEIVFTWLLFLFSASYYTFLAKSWINLTSYWICVSP